MKATKILKIGKHTISSTEDLAKLIMLKGKKNICEFLDYMKNVLKLTLLTLAK